MALKLPSRDELAEVLRRSPEHGVISVCLPVEPGDRSQGWRVELRDRLREIESQASREQRAGVAAAVKRILARFPEGGHPPVGRGQFGFVEAADRGWEEWYSTQLPPPQLRVVHRPGPAIMPLLVALEQGRPRAVALISAERVRLARWEAGALEELDTKGLETMELDWRERKAMRPADPAQAQGVSASGRDRFDARLEENRKRFLHEVGGIVAREAKELELDEVLAIGPPEQAEEFLRGMNGSPPGESLDGHDLISGPLGALEDRITQLVRDREARHQAELVAAAIERGNADLRGALGPRAVADALVEGRVEHLLVDEDGEVFEPGGDAGSDVDAEWLVERALETAATITPITGEPADALGGVGGTAALLRY